MNNEGTLVIAPIRPYNESDIYPSAYANEVKGGFHTVNTYNDLTGITLDRREEGMYVNVIEEDKLYMLSGSTWVLKTTHGYDDTELRTELSGETSARISGDTSLSAQITLVSSGSSYNTLLDPNLTMPSSVGGIVSGTKVSDLSGKTYVYMWDNLLFPTVPPTLTAPSKTFSTNASLIYEEGTSISAQFTSAFDRGSIYNGATWQNYRSGLPSSFNYTGSQLVTTGKTTLSDTQSLSNYVITLGNQSWTNTVSYSSGPQPLDNKGNPSGTPLNSGTTSTSTITIEGVYPLFASTVTIGTLTQQSLISMSLQQIPSTNGFTLVSESGGNKQQFDIPLNWSGYPISSVETFDTNSNSWVYEGGTIATSLTYWAITDVTHSSRSYKRFTYNGGDRGSITIRINM